MSMHEVEDLVHSTVIAVSDLDLPAGEKRQLFANLYRLQGFFDTSNTYFRVMDVLLQNDYMQSFEISEYPPAAHDPEHYRALAEQGFTYLPGATEASGDDGEDGGAAVAMWDDQTRRIYVEFGSPQYMKHDERVVYEAPLTASRKFFDLVRTDDPTLAFDWTRIMTYYLLDDIVSGDSEQLIADHFADLKPLIAELSPVVDRLRLIRSYEMDEEDRDFMCSEATIDVVAYLNL